MKNFKKVFSMTLSFVLMLSLMVLPVSAAEAEGPQITVEHSQEVLKFPSAKMRSYNAVNARSLVVPSKIYDLRDTPAVTMEFPEFAPEKTIYSTGAFRTNSTQIILKMTADTFGYIRVSLMDRANRTMLAQRSMYIDPWTTTITFSNLTSIVNYYFQFDNVGQTNLYMKGIVQEK